MKNMRLARMLCTLLAVCLLTGCMPKTTKDEPVKVPQIDRTLQTNEEGIPVIRVYNLKEELSVTMDIESYVEGVLAGEMKNDWPQEALKAQAVLARTFVMKFLETKKSMYEDADISTDVKEAQAYAQGLVNDRIKTAVRETRGQIVSYDGGIANTWFHAHSGGVTELPVTGLEYRENPPYTKSVKSEESPLAPDDVKNWTADFTDEEMLSALKELGIKADAIETMEIYEKGVSGRASVFLVNGQQVSAPELRIRLGPEKMKSTLLMEITRTDDGVRMQGKGYGHGVGMSQWGAYAMAENGKNYREIIEYYFENVDIVSMWN